MTGAAYNARYPVPTNPAIIGTAPNPLNAYIALPQTTPVLQFNDAPSVQPNNSYYSIDLPGAHLVSLTSYVRGLACS